MNPMWTAGFGLGMLCGIVFMMVLSSVARRIRR